VATGRQKHGTVEPVAPRGRIPSSATVQERRARKLRTKKGKREYSKRKGTVEPVFGQTKEVRSLRRFLLRGLEAVQAEWSLICTTQPLEAIPERLVPPGRLREVCPFQPLATILHPSKPPPFQNRLPAGSGENPAR
jgi:Transposase DDE domain